MRAQAQDDPDAISIHEDTDDNTPHDHTAQEEEMSRPALKDITEDNYPTTTDEVAELKQSTRGKKVKGGSRKGKQAQKDHNEVAEVTEEVTEQPTTKNSEGGEQQPELQEQDIEASETLAPAHSPVPSISETEEMAAQTPDKNITTTSKTPKFDPVLHAPEIDPDSAKDESSDSFVGSIKTRSPIKLSREPSRDSFVDSIKSRSPAKQASRIEDSVEAMDALEDAIEEVSIKLPQIEHIEIESPVKERQNTSTALPPSARKTALDAKVVARTPKSARQSPIKTKAAQLRQAPPRTDSGRVSTVKPPAKGPTINKSTTRPSTVMPKSTATEATKAMMSFSNSPLKAQPNLAKKRVPSGALSTSKPAFVPAKSSKPPTKSTFALPGEVIAAKLKAQREAQKEERAKQEEDVKNKKAFKARPAPSMSGRPSVLPRENKASLARKSSAPTADGQAENKENVAPKAPLTPRTSIASGPNSKTLDIKKTRPEPNSSVRRTTNFTPPTATKKFSPTTRPSIAPKPTSRPSMAPRVASLAKSTKSSPPSSDSTAQQKPAAKISGKEVYARTKLGRDKEEKEKREKEEAAKKARAEAAERGRLASREWAERQKRKMEAGKASKAVEESPAATTPTEAVPMEAT